jgi:hypothetical protein
MTSSTTAVPRLSSRIHSCPALPSPAKDVAAVGMMMAMQERKRRELVAWLAVALNVCVW